MWTTLVLTVGVVLSRNLPVPEYQYIDNEYGVGSSLIIDEITYVEIHKDDFDSIKEELEMNGIEQPVYRSIIQIEYPFGDAIWNYSIKGNEDKETRILLRGEDSNFFDSNRPDFYFCRIDILYSYLELTKYQYSTDGYTIEGNDVIYKEIDLKTYEAIQKEFREQYIEPFAYGTIGRINYKYADNWKLILHGNIKQEERILLRVKERYAYYDESYPEVYYCREDIYNLYIEHGTLNDIDLNDYVN